MKISRLAISTFLVLLLISTVIGCKPASTTTPAAPLTTRQVARSLLTLTSTTSAPVTFTYPGEDWDYPSPLGFSPRGPGYLRMSFLFDTLTWKDENGAIPIALAQFVMEFQHVILAESGLSFLGLGDPTIKSWGMILSHAFHYPTIFITDLWMRWVLPPGGCITLVVLALTFVGLSLEEWANPRLRVTKAARPSR